MVKGVSKQVILLRHPDAKLFEQAIFILREDAEASNATEEALLKEATVAANYPRAKKSQRLQCLFCGVAGAAITAALWLVSILV